MTYEHEPLLEKLKALSGDQLRRIGFHHAELMKLIDLLEVDALPLDSPQRGGYRITMPCIGQPERSVMGPGMLQHDVPTFQTEHDAEVTCRCLGRAFAAGQRNRAAAINQLLADTWR
jgi:hypothetical protein